MAFCGKATVYVTIGTLLLCPYLCLGQVAAVYKTSTGVACDCQDDDCCCPMPASDSDGNRPSDSDSRTQGGTCLCHGAILQSPVAPPSLDCGPVTFSLAGDLSAAAGPSLRGDGLLAVDRAVCHFPAADSGREVRALIDSLLL
jgi:hypothetical protein